MNELENANVIPLPFNVTLAETCIIHPQQLFEFQNN